jgi:hypothetical protein
LRLPFLGWRWGESNPRPTRCQRRHLRAQPTASFRNTRTLSASTLMPYPELSFPAGPGSPGGGVPHCVALIRRGGHPPAGQERLSTLPVRNFRLHLYLYRLFNEDSGDLGSLPAPQLSRSKPCHPRIRETLGTRPHPYRTRTGRHRTLRTRERSLPFPYG